LCQNYDRTVNNCDSFSRTQFGGVCGDRTHDEAARAYHNPEREISTDA